MFHVWVIVDFNGYAQSLAPPGTVGINRQREFQAQALRTGVDYWKGEFLPNRFLPGAERRQHHQERKKIYQSIKERLARGEVVYIRGERIVERVQRQGKVNVVRSGRTENMARGASAIRATPTKASVRIQVTKAVARRPGPGKPNMAMEILFTPDDEREELREVIGEDFSRKFKSWTGRKRVRL